MEALINAIYVALLKFPLMDATEDRAASYKSQFGALASVPDGLTIDTIPQLERLRNDASRAWEEWKAFRSGPFWQAIPSTDSLSALTGARLYAAYLVRQWSLDASIRALETSQAPAAPAPSSPPAAPAPAPSSSSSKRPAPSSSSSKRPAPGSPSSPPAAPAPAPSSPPAAPGLPEIVTEESREASAGGVLTALVIAGAFLWFMLKKKG